MRSYGLEVVNFAPGPRSGKPKPHLYREPYESKPTEDNIFPDKMWSDIRG